MEKKLKKQSIAESSIEELVNSSLDLAAESVNADTHSEVESTPIAHETDDVEALVQTEELNILKNINSKKNSEIETAIEIEESSEKIIPDSDPVSQTDKSLNADNQEQKQDQTMDIDTNIASAENELPQIDKPEINDESNKSLNMSDASTESPKSEPAQQEPSSPNISIESLEIEASELESEILIEMDKLVAKADHLKDNIQSELKRVCTENEQLQQEVDALKEKLNAAEGKIQSLSDDQSRQQATLKKIIMILKGVNAKISHL